MRTPEQVREYLKDRTYFFNNIRKQTFSQFYPNEELDIEISIKANSSEVDFARWFIKGQPISKYEVISMRFLTDQDFESAKDVFKHLGKKQLIHFIDCRYKNKGFDTYHHHSEFKEGVFLIGKNGITAKKAKQIIKDNEGDKFGVYWSGNKFYLTLEREYEMWAMPFYKMIPQEIVNLVCEINSKK